SACGGRTGRAQPGTDRPYRRTAGPTADCRTGECSQRGGLTVWGIVPAAGKGSRIQPLAFSKELLPVGSRLDGATERPLAVSEYLVERMIAGGANKICFVVSPGKTDILEYYGSKVYSADVCYTVQTNPSGLCDAIFR